MKARILTVDILRPLFVLLIICCHFSVCYLQYDISGFHNFFFKIGNIDFGQLATVGFFVISGWTLAFGGALNPITFYRKRFSKIYPLLYICYLMWFPYQAYLHRSVFYNGSPIRFIWTLLGIDYYVGAAFPTYAIVGEWFTGAIIVLYFLYPLLSFLQEKCPKTTTVTLFALYLINAYIRPLYIVQGHESIAQDLFPFWCGMMLARGNIRAIVEVNPLFYLLPAVFLSIAPSNLFSPFNSLIIILLVIFSIVNISEEKKARVAESKVCKLFNKYSYPIYLLHHQTIYIIMEPFKAGHLNVVFGVALLGLCIVLSIAESVFAMYILNLLSAFFEKNVKKKQRNAGPS